MRLTDPLRHHRGHAELHGAFGGGGFGQAAERIARFFGTAKYIVGQTLIVIVWLAFNSLTLAGTLRFDKYPFILLNLAFSTQAAYAAPLILLAQTRQADRDKASETADAAHREEIAQHHATLLQQNTEMTSQIAAQTSLIAHMQAELNVIRETVCPDEPNPSAGEDIGMRPGWRPDDQP